jgi:hypothetical protein
VAKEGSSKTEYKFEVEQFLKVNNAPEVSGAIVATILSVGDAVEVGVSVGVSVGVCVGVAVDVTIQVA